MLTRIADFFRKPPILMVIVIAVFIFAVLVISGELTRPAEHEEKPTHRTEVTKKREVEPKAEGEEKEKKKEKEKEKEKEKHHPPPVSYFVQWTLLLATLGFGAFYAFKIYRQGRPKHEGILLAYILTLLVFAVYGLGYLPAIKEYHELGWASFFKFILLILATVVVTFYGVLGRHDEH